MPAPGRPDRDRFVLSKGHAALALYAALRLRGWLDRASSTPTAATAACSACIPSTALPGVDFSTGSLGHGLSIARGRGARGAAAGLAAPRLRR